MNGRMKSFIEDTVISIVIIMIIVTLYYVISNFMLNNDEVVEEKKVAIVIDEEKVQEKNATIIIDDKIEENLETNETKDTNQTMSDKKKVNSIEKQLISDEKEKKVDREKLKSFINNLEENIAKSIDYNLDENSTNQEEYLKIRVTLLKSGDYEQLTFVEGNEKLFEKNKENITNTFPLSINKDIIEEFPRYIRIELKKKF